MKKLFLLLIVCFAYTIGFSQQIASSCGSGCSSFTTRYRSNNACGGENADKVFTVTNNTDETMSIKFFDKQRKINSNYGYNGYWKSDGYATIAPGGSTTFESCGSTGENILFYRTQGSNDKFPSQDDVDTYDR